MFYAEELGCFSQGHPAMLGFGQTMTIEKAVSSSAVREEAAIPSFTSWL